jgi:hypothetical protein
MAGEHGKRFWLGGAAAVAVVIVLAGWFGLVGPKLSSTSTLRAQADTVQQDNLALQAKVSRLRQENQKIDALTVKLRSALAALPFDSGLPEFTRQLTNQAAQHHVSLNSITVAQIISADAVPAGGGTTGATASAAGSVFAVPVTLLSGGSAANQLAFLNAVRIDGPRRALITSTQLAPPPGVPIDSVDASCSMTTQLTVFTAPLTEAQKVQLQKFLSGNVSG